MRIPIATATESIQNTHQEAAEISKTRSLHYYSWTNHPFLIRRHHYPLPKKKERARNGEGVRRRPRRKRRKPSPRQTEKSLAWPVGAHHCPTRTLRKIILRLLLGSSFFTLLASHPNECSILASLCVRTLTCLPHALPGLSSRHKG